METITIRERWMSLGVSRTASVLCMPSTFRAGSRTTGVPFSGCVFLSVIVCPLIPESIIGGDGPLQQGGGTPPQPEEAEREFLMWPPRVDVSALYFTTSPLIGSLFSAYSGTPLFINRSRRVCRRSTLTHTTPPCWLGSGHCQEGSLYQ